MRDMKPVRHPASEQMSRDVAARFVKLQNAHRVAAEYMWLGTLLCNFTSTELAAIPDYLSARDRQLLRAAK